MTPRIGLMRGKSRSAYPVAGRENEAGQGLVPIFRIWKDAG